MAASRYLTGRETNIALNRCPARERGVVQAQCSAQHPFTQVGVAVSASYPPCQRLCAWTCTKQFLPSLRTPVKLSATPVPLIWPYTTSYVALPNVAVVSVFE